MNISDKRLMKCIIAMLAPLIVIDVVLWFLIPIEVLMVFAIPLALLAAMVGESIANHLDDRDAGRTIR